MNRGKFPARTCLTAYALAQSCLRSVVVHDFDVFRMPVNPAKTDSKLVVDTDAVLPGTISPELLQPIARWHTQKIQRAPSMHEVQFSACCRFNIHKALHPLPVEQCLGLGTTEAFDHRIIVYRLTIYHKASWFPLWRSPHRGAPGSDVRREPIIWPWVKIGWHRTCYSTCNCQRSTS